MPSPRERIQDHRNKIDFLVEVAPNSSLFDLRHVQLDLKALLGGSPDVVSVSGLKDRDQHIRQEAGAIFDGSTICGY
jgi:predicted nucleotidyltransferase